MRLNAKKNRIKIFVIPKRNIGITETQLHVVMMVDLSTRDEYQTFFEQVKNLGMAQKLFQYVVVSLVSVYVSTAEKHEI